MSTPPIEASRHAQEDRWPIRSHTPQMPLTDAWEDSLSLEITYQNSGHGRLPRHDEARYHPPSGTVIFRRDTSLVTCYNVTPTGVTSEYGRAARLSVIDQYGPPEHHPDYHGTTEEDPA